LIPNEQIRCEATGINELALEPSVIERRRKDERFSLRKKDGKRKKCNALRYFLNSYTVTLPLHNGFHSCVPQAQPNQWKLGSKHKKSQVRSQDSGNATLRKSTVVRYGDRQHALMRRNLQEIEERTPALEVWEKYISDCYQGIKRSHDLRREDCRKLSAQCVADGYKTSARIVSTITMFKDELACAIQNVKYLGPSWN
jgi:hypothetical protein